MKSRVALYDVYKCMCRDSSATKCQFMLLYGFLVVGELCVCTYLKGLDWGESLWLHGYAFFVFMLRCIN